jgi:hypothetical protein
MRQTWRWFGPVDRVTIADFPSAVEKIKLSPSASAQGIVVSLHSTFVDISPHAARSP